MLLRKRVGAFLIDIFLVCMISIALGNLSYLNPYKDKYEEASTEYKDIYYEYEETLFNESSSFESLDSIYEFLETGIIPALKNIEKYYIFYSLWYLIIYFLYFGIFTYFNEGQTLGKRVFKIRVVDKGDNKLSFNKVIRRCLINGTNLYYGINIIIILKILATFIKNVNVFAITYVILELLGIALELSLLITLFISRGKKLTNDFFAGTEVIEVK
ncbi:MAG: RDD family protein [Erysipelotrichales bacterium]|nr:RDD family protein [Erysipelotrichales bacterium]